MKTPANGRVLDIKGVFSRAFLIKLLNIQHIRGPSEQVPDSLKEQLQGFPHTQKFSLIFLKISLVIHVNFFHH